MGRRRSQRACASAPSMLSSARGSPELRHRSESEAEVSAAAEGATGSEVAPPGDRGGRTRGSGRGSAATTSSTGEAEGAERGADTPARKPDPEAGRMDHHQLGTGRYQVLHNEDDNSESSAAEQPSASSSAAQPVEAAASAPALDADSSPPPYSSITVDGPATSDADVYSEFYPVPPPYSVATSLPTYDEAEKAKAAALAAAAADAPQRVSHTRLSSGQAALTSQLPVSGRATAYQKTALPRKLFSFLRTRVRCAALSALPGPLLCGRSSRLLLSYFLQVLAFLFPCLPSLICHLCFVFSLCTCVYTFYSLCK